MGYPYGMYSSDNTEKILEQAPSKSIKGYIQKDSSPLYAALRAHFAAFDGLTEAAKNGPIYKDREEETKGEQSGS